MQKTFTSRLGIAALALAAGISANGAGPGAPHTVKADAHYSDVTLSWQAPQAEKLLQWHDGSSYNGTDGVAGDPQKAVVIYMGARFDANDLVNNVDDIIDGITFFMYRNVISQTVLVYEDGKVVASAKADPAAYKKNAYLTVPLPEPVTIKAGSEYIFAVRFEAGQNADFVANKDRSCDHPGKGDLYSFDGKTWKQDGVGDFMVAAHLANGADQAPDCYNIYRDGQKVGTTTDLSYTLEGEPAGQHVYLVAASYAGTEYQSPSYSLTTSAFATTPASANLTGADVDGLNVSLAWAAPLAGGDKLTWAKGQLATGIGGTASSNTKVWIRNSFDASDLNEFAGASITAINATFNENTMSKITLWVTEDNVLVYSEDVSDDAIKAIEAKKDVKFPLAKPFQFKDGHEYAYGLYLMHTAKTHPCGVSDDAEVVNVKSNSFSTSSPNSSNFLKSKPSWKTLAQGNIGGCWTMSADITGSTAAQGAVSYDVLRDGQAVATGISDTKLADIVPAPGRYDYSIVAHKGGKASLAAERTVEVALPAEYAAPNIVGAQWDNDTKTVSLAWNTYSALSHCGDAYAYFGFDEETQLMWGSEFSADELAQYAGLEIKSLRVALGDVMKDGVKIGIYTTKGVALAETQLAADDLEPLLYYTLSLDKPVTITGEESLVLAYSGTIAAGTHPILVDAGPLAAGGARISFTNGANWMNLSSISQSYNKYNILISAYAGEPETAAATALVHKGATLTEGAATGKVLRLSAEPLNIESSAPAAPAKAAPARPKIASFNIYRNGELVANTTETAYSEQLKAFGVFSYSVSAVYQNGWESAKTPERTVSNEIAQKAEAPYGLEGTADADGALSLKWTSPTGAVNLSYITTPDELKRIGMTSTNPTSYCMVRFPADEMAKYVGHKVDRIRFALAVDEVKSVAAVVAFGENIVYMQDVTEPVVCNGSPIVLNDVRLNEPVAIPAGQDVYVGYAATYATGLKPLGVTGTAIAGTNDIISSSASQGYWYSLKTKFKLDMGWYINATIAAPDQEVKKAAATEPAQYRVYRDGVAIATVTEPQYKVAGAVSGKYTVVAVDAEGNESAESNAVIYNDDSAVSDITADGAADGEGRLYDLQGRPVVNPTPGLYLRRTAAGTVKVAIK